MNNNEQDNRPGSQPDNAFSQYPPEQDYYNQPPQELPPEKHSGLGIASFVIALVSVVLVIIGIAMAASTISDLSENDALIDQFMDFADAYGTGEDPAALNSELFESEEFSGAIMSVLGALILIIGAIGLAFIGLILGIIGLVIKNRRKVFGIIGVVLNTLIFFGAIILFISSLALSATS